LQNLFERVLFATDLSPASVKVFESLPGMLGLGLKEARLIYVLDLADISEGVLEITGMANRELGKMAGRLISLGVRADFIVKEGVPAGAIAAEAEVWGATLILLASDNHGGLARFLVGDTALDVMHAAKTPVLVERRPEATKGHSPLHRALVPVDFTESSEEVLDRVRELSGWALKEAVLVHVVEGSATKEEEITEVSSAENLLADIAVGIKGAGAVATAHIHVGRVAKEISEIAAEEGATVIIMGSHMKGRIKEALSGCTPERVLHKTGISVLYFPQTGPPYSGSHIP
jgi:nucleotide-binding universal stress UspA family protein